MMRKLTLTFLGTAAVVCAFAMSNVVGQGDAKTPAMPAEDVGPVNRYQIISIQETSETNLWMIDTCTGRTWKKHAYPDGDHWMQTIREDYPAAGFIKQPGMPPKPPSGK
ncbi:MAG: hypothetical protein ACKVS6_16985 [Planctomycetota bacterium]